ncbi:MAG: VOC family protein [Candidatus Binatia bacterium]
MQPPFAIRELDHVVLRCHDPVRMLDFYTRVLGMTEERRLDEIGLVQLRAGRSLVDLVPRAEGEAVGAPANLEHLCLAIAVKNMTAVVTFLGDAGVETMGDPTLRYGARGMGLSLYVRDPEGNVVELTSGPESSD